MKIFETVSFHIVKPCNAKCKFCYATFDDMHVKMMSLDDAKTIIKKLADAGVQKITFAGGEPMLFPWIGEVIKYTKTLGVTTSLITNGFLLSVDFLDDMKGWLDWIGISIDSVILTTNQKIGRTHRGHAMHRSWYEWICQEISDRGYHLKVNTVVCSLNKNDDLNSFLNLVKPERWKVFQALRVEGQNDAQFDSVKVSDEEFNIFLTRHREQESMVDESNVLMRGSYLLVDPQGRLFENSAGCHTYSNSLIHNDINYCLSQISVDREMFLARGGVYNW